MLHRAYSVHHTTYGDQSGTNSWPETPLLPKPQGHSDLLRATSHWIPS